MAPMLLVENLPIHTVERDADEMFSKFGRIVSMQLRFQPREPPYAFVEYEDISTSERACKEIDGLHVHGSKLRAELMPNREHTQERTQHCVRISNLPSSATSKDVKDLILGVSDVIGVEVDRRGNATAWFPTHIEMNRAIEKLDDTKFRGDRIRVRQDEEARKVSLTTPTTTSRTESRTSAARSRSRSPQQQYRRRSRSRSATRSSSRSFNDRRSRSRSRSPRASRRTRSRSRSR